MLLPAGLQLERARTLLADPGDITIDDIKEFISLSSAREETALKQTATREARTRRLRLAVSSSVFGLVVFLGIASVAWQQRNLANQSRERSIEIAYGFVEATASMSDRVGVPVSATLILLKQSEQTLDELAAFGGESANLEHRRAQIMIRVARTYAETGDSDKRLGNALKAVKILERLIETNPDNSQYVDDLASGMEEIGNGYMVRGDLSAALASFLNARSIRSRLIGSPSGQRDLSVTTTSIGDVLAAQGNLPAALTAYRDSLAIAERLAAADPGNAGWQRDLSVSLQQASATCWRRRATSPGR